MNAFEDKELSEFFTKDGTAGDNLTSDNVQQVDTVVEEMAISEKEVVASSFVSPYEGQPAVASVERSEKLSLHAETKLGSPLVVEGKGFRVDISDQEEEEEKEQVTSNERNLFDEDEVIEQELIAAVDQIKKGVSSTADKNYATVTTNRQDIIEEEEKILLSQDFNMNLFDGEEEEVEKNEEQLLPDLETDKQQQKQENETSPVAEATTEADTDDDQISYEKKRGSKPVKEPKKKKGKKSKKVEEKSQVESEAEAVEEAEEAEYEIEKIVAHKIYKGKVVKYEIKWKGYGSDENTTESASTIHDDIYDLCARYWDSLPNIPRPSNAPVSKNTAVPVAAAAAADVNSITQSSTTTAIPTKRKRTSSSSTTTTTDKNKESKEIKREPVEQDEEEEEQEQERETKLTKKIKRSLDHVPQYMLERGYKFPTTMPNSKTKWNIEMKKFSAVQLSPIDKSVRMAYIEWNNGDKTIHTLEEIHQKCPEKLIQYYEERLRFV